LSEIEITIGDYANPNFSTTGGLFTIDSSGNFITPPNTKYGSVPELVNYANGFLDSMVPQIDLNNLKMIKLDTGGDFVNEKYEYKTNLTGAFGGIGYNFCKVLRDVGADNLKKAIDLRTDLSSTIKEKMKKYAEEFTKYIHRNEAITGTLNDAHLYPTSKKEEWPSKYDSWHQHLLKRRSHEYPYQAIIDWRKFFEFMKTVFPAEFDTYGNFKNLKDQTYLNDSSDSSYLKPSKSGETGWENLTLLGYYKEFSTLGAPSKYKTMAGYAFSSDNQDFKLRKQAESPAIIAKDKNFKAVTTLWWQCFGPLMNNKSDVNDNEYINDFTISNQMDNEEKNLENSRKELRYCKSIKAILKELGLLDRDDQYDSFLLEISDAALKGSWINPRQDLLKDKWQVAHYKKENIYELVKSGKVWNKEYDYKKFGVLLDNLSRGPASRIKMLELEVEGIEKTLNGFNIDEVGYQVEINNFDLQIAILKEMDEFDDSPLPEKENKFDKVYKMKDSQEDKWTYWELQQLRSFINKIKEEMDDAKFKEKEYDKKENEIKLVEDWLEDGDNGGKKERKDVDTWESLLNEKGGALTEAIKQLIADKDASDFTLEKVRDGYKKMTEKLWLNEKEKNNLKIIEKAIANPNDYKDEPPSDLTEEELTKLFNFTVDKALKDNWTKVDNKTVTKADLKKWVTDDYAPTASKHNDLLAHLSETGEGLKGENKTDYKISTDAEKKESWEKFIKKGPKVVIKTIVNHEFEKMSSEDKDKKRKEMEDKKSSDDQPLDESKYEKDKDGKFTDEAVKKFLYEEKIGKSFEFKVKEEKKDEPSENGEKAPWYSWKSTTGKILYIGGGTLLFAGVLVTIFWKQISAWWSGPAEEEGQGAEESDEKEE